MRVILTSEQENWKGADHYLFEQALSIDSPSTTFRIVANTYLRDPKTKKSVNCILANGPNLLIAEVSHCASGPTFTLCVETSPIPTTSYSWV